MAASLQAAPTVELLADSLSFTEGPALSPDGGVYFTDIPSNRILRWSREDGLSVFKEESGAANGLMFDQAGQLIACLGGERTVVRIDAEGMATPIVEHYAGKKLNSPNDLWIDPQGGIYFTDPRYGKRENLEQNGEHVYYLAPDGKMLRQVADDFVRPNGIVGTPDGQTLYIADHAAGKTYRYTIRSNGTLGNKTLFADQGSDGMSIDADGNVYLTSKAVDVYNPEGVLLRSLEMPKPPANVLVLQSDPLTLFVTARDRIYLLTEAAE
jgi:gluconolactonase